MTVNKTTLENITTIKSPQPQLAKEKSTGDYQCS